MADAQIKFTMKKTLAYFCIIAFFISCGEAEKPKTAGGQDTAAAAISGAYTGMIGDKFGIVLSAETSDGKIHGSYFYRKVGTDIAFAGTQMANDFRITEKDEKGNATGNFTGTIYTGGDSLAGQWESPDGKKKFPFWLKRAADPDYAKIRFKWNYVTMTETLEGVDGLYMQGFVWPEISGLANGEVQENLNAIFRGTYEDNVSKGGRRKELSATEYEKLDWPHDHSNRQIVLEHYDSEIITWSESDEFDGGAHPSFSFYGHQSVFLKNGYTVKVNDLLKGDWQKLFVDRIRGTTELAGNDADGEECGHIQDTLVARVSRWTGEEPVYPLADRLLIVADDYRNYGCPEIARAVFTVEIPYSELKGYIRPGSAIENRVK